jgi:hypothetical protein
MSNGLPSLAQQLQILFFLFSTVFPPMICSQLLMHECSSKESAIGTCAGRLLLTSNDHQQGQPADRARLLDVCHRRGRELDLRAEHITWFRWRPEGGQTHRELWRREGSFGEISDGANVFNLSLFCAPCSGCLSESVG